MNVTDLNIQKEIIPIFDSYLNRESRKALENLFENVPATLEEIIIRQKIIAAIHSNGDKIKSIASIRIDIEEAYLFARAITNEHQLLFAKGLNKIAFELVLDKKTKSRIVSGAIQLARVWKTFDDKYFRGLRIDFFPQPFQLKLRESFYFLEDMRRFLDMPGFVTGSASPKSYLSFIKEATVKHKSMELFWELFFEFDAYVSIASTIKSKGFSLPTFQEKGLAIENFFHPLLERPVKNSISTHANIILLTGANMSGKSTLLKSLSLCIYLAHLGLGVPASSCIIPFFNEIAVNLYSKDNLQSGLSHFMSELKFLKSAVLKGEKGLKVFAVMDELFAGTNTEDGEALLHLSIQGLQKYVNCLFIISTHYGKLKSSVDLQPQLLTSYYLDAELQNGFPLFTYKLVNGWSNHKFGMLLFEQEGLKQMLVPTSKNS